MFREDPLHGLTLGYLSFSDLSPAELLAVAAEAGFSSAGIRITGRRPKDSFPPVIRDMKALEEIIRRADGLGVRISNVSSFHLYPDIDVESMKAVLEAAARLRAAYLIAARYDPDAARFHDFLASLCEAAEGFGLRLAFEFVPFSLAPSLESALETLACVPARNLGLMLDPLHLARSGGDPADLAVIDPERIFIAQLCDAPAVKPAHLSLAEEARTARVFPGEGGLPLARFLAAIPRTAEIELEMPHASYARLPHLERARLMRIAVLSYLSGMGAAHRMPV
jgi:sugar phosphate isomerase/epimerase